MLPLGVDLAVVAAAVATLLFQGIAIWLARAMPRLSPGDRPGTATGPLVSVIVAARNEVLDLPGCLDTLLAQTYSPIEILVVDGASTDGTGAAARTRGSRVTVLDEPPIPAGWVGKNWACAAGAARARGEYLLFTDADVRYDPDAIRATVAWATAEGADLATLAPRVEMVGFWENVVLPFYTQAVLTYFRAPRVNRDTSRTAMANGQYCLVRRSAYEAVGGHAAVRGYVLEDVRLAQAFRRAGFRLRVAWAPDLLSTRMYRDRHELFEGLLKNIHGTRFSAARQLGFLAGLVGFFWLPLAVLPYGLYAGDLIVAGVGALLWVALFGKHVGFARGVRGRAAYGLLFPVAVGFYVVLVATSLVRGLRRTPVSWKGRSYPLDGEPRQSAPDRG